MRIGELNQSNYQDFLKIFGGKSNKALDSLMGKDKSTQSKQLTEEEAKAILIKSGRVEEGMFISENDTSWHKMVTVSDDVKDKIIGSVRKWFMANGNGMSDEKGRDGDELGAIMKEYRKNIPPSERLAVTWTLSQIAQTESQRLSDYVKAKVPGWQHGQAFDKSVLDDYVSGGLDIKV